MADDPGPAPSSEAEVGSATSRDRSASRRTPPDGDFIVAFAPTSASDTGRSGPSRVEIGRWTEAVESVGGRLTALAGGDLHIGLVSGDRLELERLVTAGVARSVEPNLRYTTATPLGTGLETIDVGDPSFWGLDRLDQVDLPLDGTHRRSSDGRGVLIYIIDTGLSVHGDLDSVFEEDRTERWYVAWDSTADRIGGADCDGHGTHVAGTAAASTFGVAPAARLVSVKASSGCSGSFSTFELVVWLDWIVKNREDTRYPGRGRRVPAVVNMSLGGYGADRELERAIDRVTSAGITVVVAAGNESDDACDYSPARSDAAITVGATTQTDARAEFSNLGRCVDLFAPGAAIRSVTIDDSGCSAGYWTSDAAWTACQSVALRVVQDSWSGTSMAAPHVTGVVARYLGANPRANPRKVLRSVVAGTAPSVVGAGAGSPRGVLNTLFLEGPAPDRLRVPRLTRLRLGATLGPVTFRAGAPATVRAVAGSLPPGLELDPTGRFDGSVSGYGSGAVTIRVEDVFGRGSELTVPWISVGTPDLGALETVSVVSGRRSLSVSWEGVQRPVVTRGSDVQRLEVRAIPERGPTRTCKVRVRRGSLPGDCGIPRLVGSQEYTLEVRAMNAAGWSDWIDVTAIDTGITASDRTPGS